MKRNILRYWCITAIPTVITIGISCFTYSQTLPVRYYSIKDGLPSNQIKSIFQDSRGLMWIGTSNGISVFDGISFTNYTTVNGLTNNNISDIVESSNPPGVIYTVGATGGVCKFENGKFHEIPVGTPVPSASIHKLTVDDRGEVWCLTKEGIYIVRDSVASLIAQRPVCGNFTNILLLHGTSAWLASDSILDMYSRVGTDTFSLEHHVRFPSLISTLVHDLDSSVWVGTADSNLYQLQNFQIIHRRKLKEGFPVIIADDGHGALWFFWLNNMLKLFKRGVETTPAILYPKENDLAEARAMYAYFDREDNLWIATWSKGIMVLSNRNQLHISTPVASAMACADKNAHLWAASENGIWEIFPLGNGLWDKYLHQFAGTTQNRSIYFLYIDADNKLWVNANAQPDAIKCYSLRHRAGRASEVTLLRTVIPDSSTGTANLHSILIDRQGRLWSSVYPTGIIVRDLRTMQKLRTFTLNDGIPDNSVRVIFQDRNDDVWLGGFYGGIAVAHSKDLSTTSLRKFTLNDGLPDNSIRAIYEDNIGRVWIGTRNGGSVVFQHGHFQTISMHEGLQSNAVWSIAEDDRHRIWFGTDVGLECIDATTLSPLRTRDNFLGNRVLSCGVFMNRLLWFVTGDGVTINDYHSGVPDTIPPPILITKFLVNGNDEHLNAGQEFSHDQNLCTIEFAGLSYSDPQSMRYQYRLKDVDRDWLQPTSHHFVTYATLQPASYEFQVRAINGDGTISRFPASLQFTILPPFWQRWWFYCLATAFCATLLIGLYRYRINKLLELEKLRVRIASDLHDDVGSSLTRIAVHSEVIQTTANPEKVVASSKEIGTMSREIISTLSDVVWSIDARHDSLGDLIDRIRSFALDVFSAKDIHLTFDTDGIDRSGKIHVDVRQNVYLIVKEAVNNAAKYSAATEVTMKFKQEKNTLSFIIADNGKGLPIQPKASGHGLSNMKMRAERIGGDISFENRNGLTITCKVRI